MSPTRLTTISTLVLLLLVNVCAGQTKLQKKKRKKVEDVTIKERITQHEKKQFRIDLKELGCTLIEQVVPPEPKVPEKQWPKMTPKQQQDWVRKFEASDAGKKFLAQRKKVFESAEKFEIQIEDNGSFVVYDVPAGTYGLRGRLEKEIQKKNYVFEIFGQIKVAKDVEEILLDPMSVVVTRLAKPNETTPTVKIKTFDGKATISNKILDKRNVLVSFWSLKSPPSVEYAKEVQKTFKEIKLTLAEQENNKPFQLLSICIDSDRKKALKYVVKNGLSGWHGYAKDWEHETVSEFGVRSIPSLFLLGADGKIKMTPIDFHYALNTEDAKLSKVIIDVINGKNIPTPVRTVKQTKSVESKN